MRDRFYRFLGMLAWGGTKLYLRRKLSPKHVAAATALALVAVIVVGARRNGSDS
jgi:hypothetical protein